MVWSSTHYVGTWPVKVVSTWFLRGKSGFEAPEGAGWAGGGKRCTFGRRWERWRPGVDRRVVCAVPSKLGSVRTGLMYLSLLSGPGCDASPMQDPTATVRPALLCHRGRISFDGHAVRRQQQQLQRITAEVNGSMERLRWQRSLWSTVSWVLDARPQAGSCWRRGASGPFVSVRSRAKDVFWIFCNKKRRKQHR